MDKINNNKIDTEYESGNKLKVSSPTCCHLDKTVFLLSFFLSLPLPFFSCPFLPLFPFSQVSSPYGAHMGTIWVTCTIWAIYVFPYGANI